MDCMSSKYRKIKVGGVPIDEHRYVMEQFLGRKLGRYEVVHHINGDTKDNRIENLELMSLEDHSRMHAIERDCEDLRQEMSRRNKGKPNLTGRKFTEDQVREIRQQVANGASCYSFAKKYGVAKTTICRIVSGISYSSI